MCFSAMLFDISVCMHQWCLVYSFCKEVLYIFKLLFFAKNIGLADNLLSFVDLQSKVVQ